MGNNLRPCPFCGGSSIAISETEGCVFCRDCGASTREYFDLQDARDAWNARHERTCEIDCVKSGPLYDVWKFTCCGYEFVENRCDSNVPDFEPGYCPNCGAKVVE